MRSRRGRYVELPRFTRAAMPATASALTDLRAAASLNEWLRRLANVNGRAETLWRCRPNVGENEARLAPLATSRLDPLGKGSAAGASSGPGVRCSASQVGGRPEKRPLVKAPGRVVGEGVGGASTMEYRFRVQTEDRYTAGGAGSNSPSGPASPSRPSTRRTTSTTRCLRLRRNAVSWMRC